jgi:molecular chaperone IbpA
MTRLTSMDLTPLYRNSVGIDRLFDRIVSQMDHSSATPNYPPYNIIKLDDNNYRIELAVAGFSPGDIDVNYHEGQLIITGEHKPTETVAELHYVHCGISAKRFTRTFQLADYMEVKLADVRNGILAVTCERIVPESMKPKAIAITYSN